MARVERVATANVKVTCTDAQAEKALAALVHEADIICLQEWGKGRDHILAKFPDFDWIRAEGGPPIGFRRNRYIMPIPRRVVLAKGRYVGAVPGFRSRLDDNVATLGIAKDRLTGEGVSTLNMHLPAHVEKNGGYRRALGVLTSRARMHRECVRKAELIIGIQRRVHRRRIYAAGDTNFAHMEFACMVTAHAGHGWKATHFTRSIDTVFAESMSLWLKVFSNHSDHRALVAGFQVV